MHRNLEPGAQRASPVTWMKWVKRQQRTTLTFRVMYVYLAVINTYKAVNLAWQRNFEILLCFVARKE